MTGRKYLHPTSCDQKISQVLYACIHESSSWRFSNVTEFCHKKLSTVNWRGIPIKPESKTLNQVCGWTSSTERSVRVANAADTALGVLPWFTPTTCMQHSANNDIRIVWKLRQCYMKRAENVQQLIRFSFSKCNIFSDGKLGWISEWGKDSPNT